MPNIVGYLLLVAYPVYTTISAAGHASKNSRDDFWFALTPDRPWRR
jgi:hypothetical protein